MGAKTGEALLLLARTFESQGAILEVQSSHSQYCTVATIMHYTWAVYVAYPAEAGLCSRHLHMQAIKCHVALTSGGKQLPATEVESQVALARLLMSHTQNTQEARQRLERAVSPSHRSMPHAFNEKF